MRLAASLEVSAWTQKRSSHLPDRNDEVIVRLPSGRNHCLIAKREVIVTPTQA